MGCGARALFVQAAELARGMGDRGLLADLHAMLQAHGDWMELRQSDGSAAIAHDGRASRAHEPG